MTTTKETPEQYKARRNEESRVRMAAYYKTDAYKQYLINSRERRRLYKESRRRRAGIQPKGTATRKMEEAAQAKRDAKNKEEALWSESHVKRYTKIMRNRRKAMERWENNREEEKARARKAIADMKPAYIRQQLKSMGINRNQITPELMEMKREQLSMRRLSREADIAASKQLKEEYEAITKHA